MKNEIPDNENFLAPDLFESLYTILKELFCESNGAYTLKIKGIRSIVDICWWQLPNSFDHDVENSWLAKHGYENGYLWLNTILKKINAGAIDIPNALANNEPYNMLSIHYDIPPRSAEEAIQWKKICRSFYIFFLIEGDGQMINSCRILHYTGVEDPAYARIDAAEVLRVNDYELIDMIENISVATLQYVDQSVPPSLQAKYPYNILVEEAAVTDFERIISLINLHPFDRDLSKGAQRLFDLFLKKQDLPETTEQDPYFEYRFDLLNTKENLIFADWKFEAEDMEYYLQTLLKEENWKFVYPPNIYSADLLPYVQQQLGKRELELIGFDTLNDEYAFFIVNKVDIEEILELSFKLDLGIETYH